MFNWFASKKEKPKYKTIRKMEMGEIGYVLLEGEHYHHFFKARWSSKVYPTYAEIREQTGKNYDDISIIKRINAGVDFAFCTNRTNGCNYRIGSCNLTTQNDLMKHADFDSRLSDILGREIANEEFNISKAQMDSKTDSEKIRTIEIDYRKLQLVDNPSLEMVLAAFNSYKGRFGANPGGLCADDKYWVGMLRNERWFRWTSEFQRYLINKDKSFIFNIPEAELDPELKKKYQYLLSMGKGGILS